MHTATLIIRWPLDEPSYRDAVAKAPGPVHRFRLTAFPVGTLTAGARLALASSVPGPFDGQSIPVSDPTEPHNGPPAPFEQRLAQDFGHDDDRSDLGEVVRPRRILTVAARSSAPTAAEASAAVIATFDALCTAEAERQGALVALHAAVRARMLAAVERAEREPLSLIDAARGEIDEPEDWPHRGDDPDLVERAGRAADAALLAHGQRMQALIGAAAAWAASADVPPNLRRAGIEGRDVREGIRAWLTERLFHDLAELVAPLGGYVDDDSYHETPREGVPSALAYQVHDAVTTWSRGVAAAWGLPELAVTVGPIARHDLAPVGRRYRTGVLVTLAHAWIKGTVRRVAVAEPAPAGE